MILNVLLYGGGLDSTALLLHMANYNMPNLTIAHINYGQKAFEAERKSAEYFCNKYKLKLLPLSMDMSYSSATIMKNTSIGVAETNRLELRNLAFISLVASYAASVSDVAHIYLGFHKEPTGSGFLDAKTEYLQNVVSAIGQATNKSVQIYTPFAELTRSEILELGISIDKDIIDKSYTCYEEQTCNECVHCVEKTKMLVELGEV